MEALKSFNEEKLLEKTAVSETSVIAHNSVQNKVLAKLPEGC